MSQPKHTPGPWSTIGKGYTVWAGESIIFQSSLPRNSAEGRANARLAAASPELLNLAKLLLKGLKSGAVKAPPVLDMSDSEAEEWPMVSLEELAANTIAKAEGKAP